MYHIGYLGVFILSLLHRKVFFAFLALVLLLIIIFNIEKTIMIVAIAIAATWFVSIRKRGPKRIRQARQAPSCCEDAVFLNLKFGMSTDEVKETISELGNESNIRKEGNRLFCTFANGKEAEIYLYYKASKLWRLKIILDDIPVRKLKENIHQKMLAKGYSYYRSVFFNKRCYIKQNIVMEMYYVPSGIDKLRSQHYQTWLDYMDCTKLTKERGMQKPIIPIMNSSDF